MNPELLELDTETSLEATVTKAKIIGKAIYMEFEATETAPAYMKDSKQITQIIVLPAGVGTKGSKIDCPMLYTRTVSTYSPKAQWSRNIGNYDFASGRDVNKSALTPNPEVEVARKTALESIQSIVGYLKRSFVSYNEELPSNLKIRNKPITVEVTSDDIQDSIDYKTPMALIRRIQKARVSLDFPEKLV